MKWLNNLKISLKLFVGFGAIVILMVFIASVGYLGMNDINNGMSTLYADRTLPILTACDRSARRHPMVDFCSGRAESAAAVCTWGK